MDSKELSCQELVELMTEYLEGALPATERDRFEAHLAECEGCRRYLGQMRRTVTVVGALRADELDPAAREALLAAFRDYRRD